MNMRTQIMLGAAIYAILVLLSPPVHAQVAAFTPSVLSVGSEVQISYDAGAPGAALSNVSAVTAEILIMREQQPPLLREIALTASGQVWKGVWTVDDPKSLLFMVRFASGARIDDNGEKCWILIVHGADGKPVKGAALSLAVVQMTGEQFEFKHPRNLTEAMKMAGRELSAYPDNWKAEIFRYRLMLRQKPGEETMNEVKGDLARLYEANRGNEEAVAAMLPFFEQTGQKDLAGKIRADALASSPRGMITQSARAAEMMSTREPAKRVQLVEAFINDFPQAPDVENYRMMLVNSYASLGQREKALTLLSSLPHPPGSLYNGIAWPMIEKGEDIEKGVALAKQGIDILRSTGAESKPSYVSSRQWKESISNRLTELLDTYALGLFKLNRTAEAESAYAEAYTLSIGGYADINERYVKCLLANKNYDRALAVCGEAVRHGKASEALRQDHKEAYVKAKGTEAGYDALMKGMEGEASAEARMKLAKERINTPAIDFALRGMNGQMVRLSELKGKVVVIDFWATWCGPCKMSFPYLQKVYDAFRGNPRVAIYAVNSWERVQGAQRDATVRKFIADNKYTFPVLYDDDTIEKYGVTGIPTKFVIDREGKLQFKSIGFESGDAMVKELTTQIEMLLGE
jgi:thiol-disulfide isomerase/thioredoxin